MLFIWITINRIVLEVVTMALIATMMMTMIMMTMMMMMMMMTASMVATGSGGQEMEQLKLIKQPLIYCHQQSLEKF